MNPAQRLVDAVTAFQEHDEAVQHAAAVLITDRHPNLAQRLLDSWAAVGGDEPDADVRALPPEPEVGTTVEVAADGRRYFRLDEWPAWQRQPRGATYDWAWVLAAAGPQGVRIVRDGGDHG